VDGYEDYSRKVLGLGAPSFLKAEPLDSPMAVASACGEGDTFERIAEFATQRGGIILHPYMAIEPVWELARKLSERHIGVEVIGPPPPALWIANDKSSLADIIDRLADSAWNVETHAETSPEALTHRLRDMSSRHRRIGLKRTRCASAMGNTVFNGETIASLEEAAVKTDVLEFLENTEWEEGEPVLAVEWADTEHSPSTQLWLPPHGNGAPRLDGVYEQILKGEERIFVGSRPSTLPAPVDRALVEASMAMALVFQRLGYVGRCSFDFIVTGELDGDFDIKMTECNGRWGGTSTPMSLVDRLIKGERPDYIAQDFVHPDLEGAAFTEILDATRDHLFDPATGEGRFAFYNVGPLESRGKLDVISLGETPDEALEGVEEVLPSLLGLH
jgi:predicted RNase H-like HicB family nuclease